MSRSALATGVRYLRKVVASQCHRQDSDVRLLHAFVMSRDEAAFATLVRRYGPMVGAVCRRVLGHEQDAEDAFQATFLVLAQNAARLRKKTALASFLHGTAYRIALNAKRTAARRRKHEGQVPARPSLDPTDELSWREVRTLVDEEVARLPEKYRSVFILCCLESVSQAEAAQRLGLKEGTLSSRLSRARERLGHRLARRGVDLTAVLAAMALSVQSASALSPMPIVTTIEAALATASGEKLACVVSASVAEMVKNATTAMMSKAKRATLLLLTTTLLTGAGAWTCRTLATPQPAQAHAEPAKPPLAETQQRQAARENQGKDGMVSGRVVDPEGKPVRGAKLVFTYGYGERIPHKVWAVSAADGRFAFTMPVRAGNEGDSKKPKKDVYVVAAAEGYGFAATRLDEPGATDLTLRLVKDNVPIRGRIIDLQGKPVAGVRVRIEDNMLGISKKSDLTDWLAALKAAKEKHENVKWWDYWEWLYSPAFDLLFPPVTTGSDGRFEMKGIGRERMARLRIEGPTVATQKIEVMTRATETIRVPEDGEFPKGPIATYYGADFELLAAPSRPIVGVVRDKDTGKPLAGVTVETTRVYSQSGFIKTTTDKDGRYRLEGLPKGDGNEIGARADEWSVSPGKERSNQVPYLAAVTRAPNPLGLEPITVDFALKRGVWVKGRVTEKTTGKPLQASVQYFCFSDNPNVREIASVGTSYKNRFSREDGLFQIPVLPGHGLIAVRAYQDHYVMGVGAEKIKGPRDRDQPDMFITAPHICYAGNFHTLVEINPKAGEESITCDVTLDPSRSLKGTVLGPDGKPLAGARVSGLKDMGYWENEPLPGSDFMVESLKPNRTRLLQFRHEGKKLSGSMVVRGEEKDPLRVRLEPWGILTGRLVTPEGNPLTSVHVNCWTEVSENGSTVHETFQQQIHPDKDGRFRIEGLAAGVKYKLDVARSNISQAISGAEPKNLTVRSGETKDLGDLTVKPMN